MGENTGWIKIHRKMVDWEWYDDINTKVLFFHLLLTVNYEPGRWHGIEIQRGQRITSIAKLFLELNKNPKEPDISTQNIRTALNHLKSTNEITIETTRNYTLITINKYCEYQDVTNKSTNDQQTTNKQLTTIKEYKNNKKEKNNNNSSTPLFLDKTNGQKFLEIYNTALGTSYRTPQTIEKNLSYWLTVYKLEEIREAIEKIPFAGEFWAKNMTPEMLLRRKNPQGEEVDRIGQLLNLKTTGGLKPLDAQQIAQARAGFITISSLKEKGYDTRPIEKN